MSHKDVLVSNNEVMEFYISNNFKPTTKIKLKTRWSLPECHY